jgi:hypothetical protein
MLRKATLENLHPLDDGTIRFAGWTAVKSHLHYKSKPSYGNPM